MRRLVIVGLTALLFLIPAAGLASVSAQQSYGFDISPTSGPAGTETMIYGENLPFDDDTYHVYVVSDYYRTAANPNGVHDVGTVTVEDAGDPFQVPFQIPSDAEVGELFVPWVGPTYPDDHISTVAFLVTGSFPTPTTPTSPPTPPTSTPTPTPDPDDGAILIELPKSADTRDNQKLCAAIDGLFEDKLPSGVENLVFVTHGWNGPRIIRGEDSQHPEMQTLADAIQDYLADDGKADEWIVVNFRWNVMAETPPTAARNNAARLGRCVGDTLADRDLDHAHLVAHSAGTKLIDEVARDLDGTGTTTHLTHLDAYVPTLANADLATLGSTADFADHYLRRDFEKDRGSLDPIRRFQSYFLYVTDRPLGQACNIDLSDRTTPSNVQDPHIGPVHFYTQSVGGSAGSWGFGRSKEVMGAAWAPPTCAPATKGQLRSLNDSGQLGSSPGSQPPQTRRSPFFPGDLFKRTSPSGSQQALGPNGWSQRTASPVTVSGTVVTSTGDSFLAFTYEFLTSPGDAYLTVMLDGEFIFEGAQSVDGDGPLVADLIPLPPGLAPGEHVLTFTLETFDGSVSEVAIKDVHTGSFETEDTPPPTESPTPSPTKSATPLAPRPPNTGTGSTASGSRAPLLWAGVLVVTVAASAAAAVWRRR